MYEYHNTDRDLELEMSATLENIDRADDLLETFLTDKNISIDHFAMRILLRESLLNAVTHGSNTDPEKTVRLRFQAGQNEATLKVSDSGKGFAWKEHDEDFYQLNEGGRGLGIMKIYSDNLQFNETGNEVILQKHLNCAPVVSDEQVLMNKP